MTDDHLTAPERELARAAEAATRGEKWLLKDRLVYALEHSGWHRGEETFRNRWDTYVQANADTPESDLRAIAAHIAAANPDAVLSLLARIEQLSATGAAMVSAFDKVELFRETDRQQKRAVAAEAAADALRAVLVRRG